MRRIFLSLVGLLFLGAGVHGAGPATQPAVDDAKIQSLINKLGDEDYATRESASEELKKIGKPALPALEKSRKSEFPEVAIRSDAIIRAIEGRSVNRPAANAPVQIVPGIGQGNVQVQINGGKVQINGQPVQVGAVREMETVNNGRRVHVSENAEGIKVLITETVNGQEQTHEFAAKTAEELKKEHPDAYAEYEKLAKVPAVALPAGLLGQRMHVAMVGGAQGGGLTLFQSTEIGATVSGAGEELQAQLGGGVVVRTVEPGSRAEKLGLQRLDLVQKVNGKAVASADDFVAAIKAEGKLTIEAMRQGKAVTLQEK